MDQKLSEILAHYRILWGAPTAKFSVTSESEAVPAPLLVYEFAEETQDETVAYATLGASLKPMPTNEPNAEVRAELFILCINRQKGLSDSLAEIAMYPFVNQTYFAEGHTVHGSAGQGIVDGSPLTDLLITRADYGEKPDYVDHSDGTHTHLFWVIPVFKSEREYAVAHGWRKLQEIFEKQQTDVLDFWRSAAV